MARDNRIPAEGRPAARGSSSESGPAARVLELHAMVREARMRLTAPTVESLDACRSLLEEAVREIEKLQRSLPRGAQWRDKALAAPLGALRTEIAGVQILLDGAAAFYTGWMRLASSMASGYTADGNPAPSEASPRVLLEV
ncbi:MAG: hypothetical protein LAP39_28790 [Acidobacteriia bacterium]|nr:hypothetical protein [Terriglobia bacterium]